MSEKTQFTIKEFAHLTGIKKDNLRFYDRIGLLSPQSRGDNKYRYYSRMQLNKAYLIYTLRSLGVSIEEIRVYMSKDSATETLSFFLHQQQRVTQEIKRLQEIKDIIGLYTTFVQEEVLHTNQDVILKEKNKEAIFLCPLIPEHMDEDEAIICAYDYAIEHHINTGHPLGAMKLQKHIMSNDVNHIHRYYFLLHNGKKIVKKAGLYVVAYSNSKLECLQKTYQTIIDFINKNDLIMCGNAYEEYLLEDFCIANKRQNDVRIEIPVGYKETN